MSLSLSNVGYRYGSLRALVGIHACAPSGRVTALVGPNAAGKTTLLRCLMGALRPQRGEVRLDGELVHRIPPRRLAQRVAYVPQRPSVAAAFTVREVVELGRYALAADPHAVDRSLTRLDLGDLADRPYPALSVGQQQRVALARADAQLARDGHLILDEPTAAMDLRHVRDAMRLLRGLADDGAAVVIALHDLTLAAALADEVWLLAGGCLEAVGPAPEVLEPDRLESIFGVPFERLTRRGGRITLLADASPDDPL